MTRFILMCAVFVLLLFGGEGVVFAQGTVDLLVTDIPGVGAQSTLQGYLQGIFQLGLGVAVVLAVLQLVIGGFTYMTSDSVTNKSNSQDRMWKALQGLILAFATVLILQTINPDILDLNINFGDGGGRQGDDTGSIDISPAEQAVRDRLSAAGININNGPCAAGQTSGCTNVAGLPNQTINDLVALKNECDCTLVITGGTEDGHATHGVGESFVDLRKTSSLGEYITSTQNCSTPTPLGDLYRINNNNYVDERSHWHACVGTSCRINGHSGTC